MKFSCGICELIHGETVQFDLRHNYARHMREVHSGSVHHHHRSKTDKIGENAIMTTTFRSTGLYENLKPPEKYHPKPLLQEVEVAFRQLFYRKAIKKPPSLLNKNTGMIKESSVFQKNAVMYSAGFVIKKMRQRYVKNKEIVAALDFESDGSGAFCKCKLYVYDEC